MGAWIFKKKARHDDWSLFMCSECGRIIDPTVRDFALHSFDFCPRCGAKMYEDGKDIYVPNKGE